MTSSSPAAPGATDGGATHGTGATEHHPVDVATVEAVVRQQLSKAMGGRRGMAEAAIPTISFTGVYVSTKDVTTAIAVSVTLAVALLVVRLVQRSNPQFVLNALVGIGIGCLFVWLGGRNGGDESAKALAYFVPGLIYNAVYTGVLLLSILARWPVVGLMVGAVAEDPFSWHRDRQIVRLCSTLTWILLVPCAVRVAVQLPIYLGGRAADDADPYVTALGVSKVVMGWPLQLAALGLMVWLLSRDRTPVAEESGAPTGRPA